MQYEILLKREAEKGLDSIPEREYEAVAESVADLSRNPRPVKAKKLTSSELWRLRVGRYRVVYAIDDKSRTLTLVKVARRSEDTYKRL